MLSGNVRLEMALMPVKITICVAPREDMPPHTCTFTGCFALSHSRDG